MKKFKSAFSLIEISIVILVIGLIVAGVTQANRLVSKSAITSAQAQTSSSPVPLIDGLTFWVESTSEKSFLSTEAQEGLAISSWFNINPVGIYGIGNGTQTGTARPTYKEKIQNNLPVARFDGTDDFLSLPDGTVPSGDNEYTVFIVASVDTNTCDCDILSSGDGLTTANSQNSFGFNGSDVFINRWGLTAHDGTWGSALSGKFHIYSVVYTPGSTQARSGRVDGTATNDLPTIARASLATYNRIGAKSVATAAGFFDGDIAEIIAYSKALKTEEIDDVQKYLSKKWKIRLN